jgi:hypothetical protein
MIFTPEAIYVGSGELPRQVGETKRSQISRESLAKVYREKRNFVRQTRTHKPEPGRESEK